MVRRLRSIALALLLPAAAAAQTADLVPPVLTTPRSITVEAAGPLTSVSYFVRAVDAVDGPVPVLCTPPSPATVPIGTTTVSCTATDLAGNIARGSFPLTVRDTRPPVLVIPPSLTTGATAPAGASLSFVATAVDAVDGPVPVTCTPSSGSFFPVGTTAVSCTASDARGNSISRGFSVTIIDAFPPLIRVPDAIAVEATSPQGAHVSWDGSAVDAVDGPVPLLCLPPSGSLFPVGTTLVSCSARDSRGNDAAASFPVTVRDLPPVIVSIRPSEQMLWPPNHKMVAVTVRVEATDDVDPSPDARLVEIRSSDADDALGDGHTSGDFEITGPLTAHLRAERSGNRARIYTLVIEVRDFSGHATRGETRVMVDK